MTELAQPSLSPGLSRLTFNYGFRLTRTSESTLGVNGTVKFTQELFWNKVMFWEVLRPSTKLFNNGRHALLAIKWKRNKYKKKYRSNKLFRFFRFILFEFIVEKVWFGLGRRFGQTNWMNDFWFVWLSLVWFCLLIPQINKQIK